MIHASALHGRDRDHRRHRLVERSRYRTGGCEKSRDAQTAVYQARHDDARSSGCAGLLCRDRWFVRRETRRSDLARLSVRLRKLGRARRRVIYRRTPMQTALCLVRRQLPQRTATATCAGVDTYAIERRRGDACGIGRDRNACSLVALHTVVGGCGMAATVVRRHDMVMLPFTQRNRAPFSDAQRNLASLSDAVLGRAARRGGAGAPTLRRAGADQQGTDCKVVAGDAWGVERVRLAGGGDHPQSRGDGRRDRVVCRDPRDVLCAVPYGVVHARCRRAARRGVRRAPGAHQHAVHNLRLLCICHVVFVTATQLPRSTDAAAECACPVNTPPPSG